MADYTYKDYKPLEEMTKQEMKQEWNEIVDFLCNKAYGKGFGEQITKTIALHNAGDDDTARYNLMFVRNLQDKLMKPV